MERNKPKFPPPARIGVAQEGLVNVSKLTGPAKRRAWQRIQERAPDLADLLRSDPNIEALRSRFGAGLLVPEEWLHGGD